MLERLSGVFERLPRQLVRRWMILFSMMYRRGSVRMSGKLVEIGGLLVRITRHDFTSLLTLAHLGKCFAPPGASAPSVHQSYTPATELTGKHRIDVEHAQLGFRLAPP